MAADKKGKDDPVKVKVNILLRNVEFIDHKNNKYKAQILLREEWLDQRLKFAPHNATADWYPEEITTNDVDHFWKPDIFFGNELEGHRHSITKPNVFARISKNGSVMLSNRFTVTLQCQLKGTLFPLVTDACKIHMASYGYTTKDVELSWKDGGAIELPQPLNFEGYTLVHTGAQTCSSQTSTGAYGCLEAVLLFRRHLAPYIVFLLLPTLLLVVSSWCVFWVPQSAVVPGLAVSSLLTLVTSFFVYYQKYSYRLPAFCILDLWMSASVLFVYIAFFYYLGVVCCNGSNKDTKVGEERLLVSRISEYAVRVRYACRIAIPGFYLLVSAIIVCSALAAHKST